MICPFIIADEINQLEKINYLKSCLKINSLMDKWSESVYVDQYSAYENAMREVFNPDQSEDK